ncbi:MAG: glycosyltransferase family 1 protein [Candidatus Microgenomates bacterium]|jgi:glycosyltransferase involved in cell wall biosynthesis
MIIGIDGNEANIENRVGVNTYAFELLKNLWKLQDEWKNSLKLIVYLRQEPLSGMPEETANFKYIVIPGGGMWILTKLMPRLIFNEDKLNVFFSPSHYAPPLAAMPRVCSIMDLGYLNFSGQFTKRDFWQLKVWSAISIFISKAIFAISNSTKMDIVRHYPFAKNKVYVTPLAYDSQKFNLAVSDKDVRRVGSRYSIVMDYVLYLGTLKPSKNIEGLIEAFSRLKVKDSNLKLVIAGKKGWMYESIFKKVEKMGLEDTVIFTDFVPESDKPALIKGAKVFVLPSFWEGFGLDVLNAMACGVPVVVSNVGSLPEVAEDAGILVDPGNIDSIAEGIERVLSMTKLEYNRTIERGLSQAKKFSWEKTARETMKVLTQV